MSERLSGTLGHEATPSGPILPRQFCHLGFNLEAEYSCLCGLLGVFFELRADSS